VGSDILPITLDSNRALSGEDWLGSTMAINKQVVLLVGQTLT